LTFSAAQQEALRQLGALWSDRQFVMVGAAAIGCHLDMRWRATADLDLSVAAEIDEYPLGLDGLAGWTRQGGEHAWRSPRGVRIDVLPVGPRVLADGVLRWPRSGDAMSVVGYRHVFSSTSHGDIGGGERVRVADLEVLALLKMVSYLARPDRTHDLADWAHIADAFVSDDEDLRFSDRVFDHGLTFEQVSPFTLAAALAPKLDATERALVFQFLHGAREPSPMQAELARRAPIAWSSDGVGLAGRLDAFAMGLESA
jgi:predicted nucleotidyltransferase